MARSFHLSHLKISLLGALLMTGLSGCNTELREVCEGRYDRTIVDARAELTHVYAQRSIASTHDVLDRIELTPDQRGEWQSWSENQLKRVENYLDWTRVNRDDSPNGVAIRRKLTDMANDLVAFHGYCQDGRLDRMIKILDELEEGRKDIQSKACGA